VSTTLDYTSQLAVQDCCVCGITFAVPTDYDQKRRNDHKLFYCPSGHSQSYVGKTEAQKQRDRADRLERQLANRDEDLRAERASHAATKGQLTKTKNRVAHGVCPCCNRSFVNLRRHMSGQHPDYVEQAAS
jgi:hypothetical protein